MSTVRDWAERLDKAATSRTPVAPLSDDGLADASTAYEVQSALIRLRLDCGDRLVGGKLGLTSKAKQIAMGVDKPLYGMVTGEMLRKSGTRLSLKELIIIDGGLELT